MILTERIIGGCGAPIEGRSARTRRRPRTRSSPYKRGLRVHAQQGRRALASNKLGQAREKLLRTGSLFASTMTRAAKELKEKAKKAAGRSPTEKVDQRACSGGGRVAASTYVQRAHLQYDTLSPKP